MSIAPSAPMIVEGRTLAKSGHLVEYLGGFRREKIREKTMIKPRRIGHATFETADIEKQIAYWTDVAGLVLAEREKKRAFLASKTGLLAVQLEQTDRAH